MANAAAKMVENYFASKDIRIKVLDEEGKVLRSGWSLDNTRIDIYFQFSDEVHDVHIEGRNFLSVPENKEDTVIKICNKLNREYRWVKFSVDTENHNVIVELDAVIELGSCGEEAYELMLRMNNIVEDAYPTFMKEMWA